MNIINVVSYLNHLHVIHLSELFTYLSKFSRPVATGAQISRDLLYSFLSLIVMVLVALVHSCACTHNSSVSRQMVKWTYSNTSRLLVLIDRASLLN